MLHVRKTDACWLWTGQPNPDGYGSFWIDHERRNTSAHRAAYVLLVGPIPTGYEVDHICRVRACVRPSHLRLRVADEHRFDNGWSSRTECANHHEFTELNTRMRGGRRVCRTCERERQRQHRERVTA